MSNRQRRAVCLLCAAALTTPLHAQDATGGAWHVWVGGGIGLDASCDACQSDDLGGSATIAVGRSLGTRWSIGGAWTGVWLDGRVAAQSRHALELTLHWAAPLPGAPFVRLGAGPTLGTVITVDGPPPECCGDVVIGVGDTGGLGGSLGTGLRLPLRRGWALVPEARVHAQWADDDELVTAVFLLSLEPG